MGQSRTCPRNSNVQMTTLLDLFTLALETRLEFLIGRVVSLENIREPSYLPGRQLLMPVTTFSILIAEEK
jgi:hypothetical protein